MIHICVMELERDPTADLHCSFPVFHLLPLDSFAIRRREMIEEHTSNHRDCRLGTATTRYCNWASRLEG